jgi:hypothetical protein
LRTAFLRLVSVLMSSDCAGAASLGKNARKNGPTSLSPPLPETARGVAHLCLPAPFLAPFVSFFGHTLSVAALSRREITSLTAPAVRQTSSSELLAFP